MYASTTFTSEIDTRKVFYAHMLIVVAFLVVNIFSCLLIASYGAGVMTWEFGAIFSYLGLLSLSVPTRTLNSSNRP